MAGPAANRSGIMTWVCAIRTTMANDPGRQILEDQIQSNGFLFLEDYLDGILAGPRRDPIIELVKTPGRKKDVAKKTRAATVAANKAKAIITLTLDEEDFEKENEAPAFNLAPINAFHKALLQSKESNPSHSEVHQNNEVRSSENVLRSTKHPSSRKEKPNNKAKVVISDPEPERIVSDDGNKEEEEEAEEEEEIVEQLVTPPRGRTLPPQDCEAEPSQPNPSAPHGTHATFPTPAEPLNDLSIIAEDDEPVECCRTSVSNTKAPEVQAQSSSVLPNKLPKHSRKLPYNIDMMDVMDIDDCTQSTTFTVSSSAQSFQTVPLDSPASIARPATPTVQTSEPSEARHYEEHSSAPLSAPPSASQSQAEQNAQGPATDRRLARKPSVSHFPTIGGPSPLRKSMRVPREPSLATTNTVPIAGPTTTRSSWLVKVKARETKVTEDIAKKDTTLLTLPVRVNHTALGSKRKSGEMLGAGLSEQNEIGRTQKMSKIAGTSPVLSMLKEQDRHPFGRPRDPAETANGMLSSEMHVDELPTEEGSEGMINKLKKTVAGFSARAEKSMGKSLGGATATALAEAKAAAEARIAERNAAEGRVIPAHLVTVQSVVEGPKPSAPVFMPPSPEAKHQQEFCASKEIDRRLRVSDLVSKYETKKGAEHERVFQPPPPVQPTTTSLKYDDNPAADLSTSTTPPNSPPRPHPPIFILPEKSKAQVHPTFFPPSSQTFMRPEPQPYAPSRVPQPLSAQSTFFPTQSTYSDAIFDNEIPPWVPSTQDTDLSDSGGPSRYMPIKGSIFDASEPETDMDADESWHLDEKFGETWTPVVIGMKDDSMTWSTAPTHSTRGDTGGLDISVPPPCNRQSANNQSTTQEPPRERAPISEVRPSDNGHDTDEEDMDVEEYGEDVLGIRLVTPVSQLDANSSSKAQLQSGQSSSNTPGGFFSSASKLVSSVLGGSKRGKEPVKSIQLAAAAAKKQQEEAEKKATRLKEMEARRQQVLQKKADEEKAREEKKVKEENERWKRDREKEDITEKGVLKQPGRKLAQMEDDLAKKQRLMESEKKNESRKPPSKDKKDATVSKLSKFINSSQPALNASAAPSKIAKQVSLAQSTTAKGASAATDMTHAPKNKGKANELDLADKQPSKVMQAQMQARLQGQLEDVRKAEIAPPVPSEAIELPDVNSEYSDSDDENRVRTFDPPHWAQSPELREALQTQSTVNPDDIFGAIRPLRMEELFKTRTSRFRARTSSANWAGPDELTLSEEREYARRMGYTN